MEEEEIMRGEIARLRSLRGKKRKRRGVGVSGLLERGVGMWM